MDMFSLHFSFTAEIVLKSSANSASRRWKAGLSAKKRQRHSPLARGSPAANL